MSDQATNTKSNVTVSLSGIMSQFSIALFFILSSILVAFIFLIKFATDLFLYLGSGFLGLLLIGSIINAFIFYLKQQNRSTQDTPSQLELTQPNGRSLKLLNPPDKVYSKEEFNAIMRFLTVSFDENLCPDGEVIGHASDAKLKPFSEDEKKEFQKSHIEEIKGKKNAILEMYGQPQSLVVKKE
jgi:hypothetical protein